MYERQKEREKTFLGRYGPRAIREGAIGLAAYVLSGGQIPLSIILRVFAQMGIEGLKMILSFRTK